MKARFHPQTDNMNATIELFCTALAVCGRPFFKDYAERLRATTDMVLTKDASLSVMATIEWILVNYHRTRVAAPTDFDLKDFKHPSINSNGAFLLVSIPVYRNGVHHLFLYATQHEGQWSCGVSLGFYEEKHLATFLVQDLFVKDARNEDKIKDCNVYIRETSTRARVPRERTMTGLRLLKQLADDGTLPQIGTEGVDYPERDYRE